MKINLVSRYPQWFQAALMVLAIGAVPGPATTWAAIAVTAATPDQSTPSGTITPLAAESVSLPGPNLASPSDPVSPTPAATPPLAEVPSSGIPPEAVPAGAFLLNPSFLGGRRIDRVIVYLENPTTDQDRNQQLQQDIGNTFGVRPGDSYSQFFLDQGLERVRRLAMVEAAQYGPYEVQIPGQVVVVLSVRLTTTARVPEAATGILVTGDWREFPNLYTSDRAIAVLLLKGGFSNFTSNNTWFSNSDLFTAGNPLAADPADSGTYSWLDGYLKFGAGGATQVGTLPIYVYGSVSNLVSTTLQPDLFESDNRIYSAIEDLYGGFGYGRHTDSSHFGIDLSAGRQDYRISNGMLLANGAGNGGERATILSNPRTVFDNTVIGRMRWNDLRLEGFYLDPDELPALDTQTRLVGANLEYNDNRSLQLGLSYLHVPQSDFSYFTQTDVFSRQGLNVIYPRIRLSNPFGIEGLWLQGEYAYQWNNNFAMAARGGWGQIGYTVKTLPWTPSLSYRYAYFSGDDPNTATFERFDPLLSGGSPDTWIQGTSLVKLYQNSNLITNQLILRLRPSQRFDVALQYIHLTAPESNNLGGTQALSFLESSAIGQEVTLTGRYNLSRNLLLYTSGSIAFPGTAIQSVVGNDPGPWYFLQLSLLLNL